jgi:UDPglucose 6-dehydrogenase
MARLSNAFGVKANEVMEGISHDKRIGPQFLSPGPGWGGSCFPKDTRELVARASSRGIHLPTVISAIESNQSALENVVNQISQALDGVLAGRTVSIWGLSFKAGTDDVRESPAVKVVDLLVKMGVNIFGYDPIVKVLRDTEIEMFNSAEEACRDSDLLVVMTEWPQFREVDAETTLGKMRSRRVVDARGILDKSTWASRSEFYWSVNEGKSR